MLLMSVELFNTRAISIVKLSRKTQFIYSISYSSIITSKAFYSLPLEIRLSLKRRFGVVFVSSFHSLCSVVVLQSFAPFVNSYD